MDGKARFIRRISAVSIPFNYRVKCGRNATVDSYFSILLIIHQVKTKITTVTVVWISDLFTILFLRFLLTFGFD